MQPVSEGGAHEEDLQGGGSRPAGRVHFPGVRKVSHFTYCPYIYMVHPQNVRFQNVRFQNVRFQNVRFQNVRFTKRQVYKTSGFKTSGFKTSSFLNLIYLLNKKYLYLSFLLITSHIWWYMTKKTSKIENKTQPSLCLQTWLQLNLRISTNHKYRIFMDVFCNRTFWRPDVL